jgi:hypothetical protein
MRGKTENIFPPFLSFIQLNICDGFKWLQNDRAVMIFRKRNLKEEEALRLQWQLWLTTDKKKELIAAHRFQ